MHMASATAPEEVVKDVIASLPVERGLRLRVMLGEVREMKREARRTARIERVAVDVVADGEFEP